MRAGSLFFVQGPSAIKPIPLKRRIVSATDNGGNDPGFLRFLFVFLAHPADHEGLTTLATEDGVEISRHMVLLTSNLSARVETALKAVADSTRTLLMKESGCPRVHYFPLALPKPPPPGVSMTKTSPGFMAVLSVGPNSSTWPPERSTQL